MKTYFLLLLFLCSIQLHAQLAVGTVLHLDNGTPGMRKETVLLDTLINGKIYKKCEAIEHGQSSIFYYLLDNQKLYRMDDQFQHWKKLYDFTKQFGDTFTVDSSLSYYIDYVGTENSMGFTQNCLMVYYSDTFGMPIYNEYYFTITQLSIFDSLRCFCFSDANHSYSRFGVCDSSILQYEPVLKESIVQWFGYTTHVFDTTRFTKYICKNDSIFRNNQWFFYGNDTLTEINDKLIKWNGSSEDTLCDFSLTTGDFFGTYKVDYTIFTQIYGKIRKILFLDDGDYEQVWISGIGVSRSNYFEGVSSTNAFFVNQTAIFQPLNSCCYPLILYNCDGTLLTRQKKQSSIPLLYPNPTQNILSFECIQGSWQITDLQGKIITAGISDGKKENISVSDLSTGIYLFIHEHFKTKFVKE